MKQFSVFEEHLLNRARLKAELQGSMALLYAVEQRLSDSYIVPSVKLKLEASYKFRNEDIVRLKKELEELEVVINTCTWSDV